MTMIDLPDHIPNLRRLKAFYVVIFVLLSVIIARLWYLQVVQGPELAQESTLQQIRMIRRVAPRGVIEDRSHHVLATSRTKFVVSVTPNDIKKNPQVLPRLAQLLGVSADDLQQTVQNALTSGVARFDQVPLIRDIDIETLSRLEENRLDLPGVLVTRDPVRYYSDDGMCTHILGVTRPIDADTLKRLGGKGYHGGDYVGVSGLERTYEHDLRGAAGHTDIAVDARGRMQRSLGDTSAVPGKTLRLALDLGLQQVAYKALKEQFDGKGVASGHHPGAVVALDPNTGGVLAFVSMPGYDLNSYGKSYGALLKDPFKPLINRASGSAYPCGSPFKLVTAAAGLESGSISTSSWYYCPGYLMLGRRRFRCDEIHHDVDFYRAIGASCNVFFFHTAERTEKDNIAAMAKRFGLGQKTDIDLPSDKAGLVPTPEWKRKHKLGGWYRGDTLNMSIGQGFVQASPLQLADFAAALANGGTLWRPHLVSAIIDPVTGKVQPIKPEPRGSLGLSPANRNAIVEGMRHALLPGGTAAASAIPGLSIAGKTGTVQIKKGVDNAVFICFAPIENPRIAIAVLVEGGGYGAQTAAPIARRMLAQFFHIHLTGSAYAASFGRD